MNFLNLKPVELHTSFFARLGLSIAGMCAVVSGAQAQDLYADIARQVYSYPFNTTAGVSQYASVTSSFNVGFLESNTQPLFSVIPSPFMTTFNYVPISKDYDLITALKDGFSSGIFWNLHPYDYTLGSGLVLHSETVTLSSVDVIPAVQIDVPADATNQYTILTFVSPVNGTSTPGTIYLQAYSQGAWSILYSAPINTGLVYQSITTSLTHKTRLRWLLARSGTAPAQATLKAIVYQ